MGSGPHSQVSVPRRILATSCAALIFFLGLCAVSPALHKELHPDAGTSADAGCVVVLFAAGVTTPVALVALPPVPVEWHDQEYVSTDSVLPESPRYLLQPGRGPPLV